MKRIFIFLTMLAVLIFAACGNVTDSAEEQQDHIADPQVQVNEPAEDPAVPAEPAVPEWDLTMPSLAETFAGHFLLGSIWSNHNHMNAFNTPQGFLHHFNAVTAENNHKPDQIAPRGFDIPQASAFNFQTSDHVVNFALENDLVLVGHTLVWHSQSPSWLYESARGVPRTRAEARANMEFYISTVSNHYDSLGLLGAFYAWDVLNEAIESGGGRWGAAYDDWYGGDWRTQLRDSPWLRAYANGYDESAGEHPSDYVYDAFVLARRYFPYSVLYYNDYNEEIPAKRNAIAQMVEQLNERWANDPLYDGRLLIEGIGLQSHYHLDQWRTNLDNLRPAIERYAATGAVLSATELDITVGGQGGQHPQTLPVPMSQADLQRQADAFARVFGYYLEFAQHIERVSLWGKADNHSWRSWGQPLLFDALLSAKPAFFSLMNAASSAAAPIVLPPSINEATLPNGETNTPYRGAQLSAQRNNHAPILWRVTDGELPPGLILFSTTGVIGGIPTQSGTYTFTVSVENIAGADSQEFTITVL
jgi:GH35 family endo-1,4-beta-xylanase